MQQADVNEGEEIRMRHKHLVLAIFSLVFSGSTLAEEVRYYEQNGVTWRESRQSIPRVIPETQWQERQQTVFRQQVTTSYQDCLRSYSTPVTQYQWVSRMHGRWNPFVEPYYTHHYVPVTHWEKRVESVPTPVVSSQWVPETRTVRVPVTTHRVANEEVIRRVAVGAGSGARAATLPQQPGQLVRTAGRPIGGVSMSGDPPRVGTGWRPTEEFVRY